MRRVARLVSLLLALVLLVGCADNGNNTVSTTAPESSGAALETQATETTPASAEKTEQALSEIAQLGTSPDDNYRTWYEIFVYSFCDSNGDGIGDLQGVISKLDYLQELGITGIWLMPIHPSTTYHKYNVSDYYAIDPDYGTLEDFDALMAECEARGIHVILDLVLNHTGSEHAWFKEAVSYLQNLGDGEPDLADCKYLDYYFFQKEQKGGYCQVPGTDWYYEAQFSYDMPDLNLENEAVREEITQIMQFWFDKGVDGFRLDAAKEFYSGQLDRNVAVLSWIQETATSINPDAYLVAEVWEGFASVTNYYASGITSLFNFPFGDTSGKIVTVLRGAGNASTVSSYATALEKADKAYSGSNPDYIDAPFLSNHDVGRIAGFCANDEYKTKLAGAMNLFMSGSAFIYYGEEIGMTGSGNDPSKRAPMYWNDARDNGTTDLPPECTLPDEYPFGSLEQQLNDDGSIYNYYRQAIAIRNALPVLSHGSTTAEAALNVGCVSAFRKTWNEESSIVLMNIDSIAAQVDLSAYSDWTLAASLSANGEDIVLDGTNLALPAYGVAVLIPDNSQYRPAFSGRTVIPQRSIPMIEQNNKPKGLSGNALRTWGMLFLVLGVAGRSIIQNQILGLGSVSTTELLEAMTNDSSIMAFATLALICQAMETCAAPIFAFLLVEGFLHTSDLKHYIIRVAAVAVLSEIPYNMAIDGKLIAFGSLNPVFSMVLGLVMLYFFNHYAEKKFICTAIKAVVFVASFCWTLMLNISNGPCLILIIAVLWRFRAKPMFRNMAGCAATAVCSIFSMFYLAAPMSFLAIHMYNKEPGARNRLVNYLTYPAVLLVFGIMGMVL